MSGELTNWKEMYEERDIKGNTVVDVYYRDGVLRGYFYLSRDEYYTTNIGNLVCRFKLCQLTPKTHRPYYRSEVKCGDVFRSKVNNADAMVTFVTNDAVTVSLCPVSYRELLDKWTRPDGSPAGVME